MKNNICKYEKQSDEILRYAVIGTMFDEYLDSIVNCMNCGEKVKYRNLKTINCGTKCKGKHKKVCKNCKK